MERANWYSGLEVIMELILLYAGKQYRDLHVLAKFKTHQVQTYWYWFADNYEMNSCRL